MDFFIENIFLIGLIVVSGVLLFFPKKSNKQLSIQDTTLLINRESSVLIDLRSELEFISGHITNAINIPFDQIENKVEKITKNSKKNIIVYCQKGSQSYKAVALLEKLGLEKAYSIEGGLDAWIKNSLPLVNGEN